MDLNTEQSPPTPRRLNSWKEIARFFQRDERTVKRWEVERGLPIRRIPGAGRSKIYAEASELEAWLKQGADGRGAAADDAVEQGVDEGGPAPRPRRAVFQFGWRSLAAGAVSLVVVLGVSGAAVLAMGRTHPRMTRDPAAAELYRQGLHDWNARTAVGLNKALDEFTQAIVRDPDFAQAYVGLAQCYSLLREYSNMPDAEAYPRAQAAAERALALDPRAEGAYAVLAFVDFYYNWDVEKAEREIRRAIELKPDSATNHLWYANMLKVQRRFDLALDQIGQAQALDPDSSTILADKGDILLTMGRQGDAERLFHDLELVEPHQMWPHAYLAQLALTEHNYNYFLTEARIVSSSRGDRGRATLLDAAQKGLAEGGGPGLLKAMLVAQKSQTEEGVGSPYAVACTYAELGDEESALSWLHVAADRRDGAMLGALTDPCMAPLRERPEFGFVRKIILGPHRAG